MTTDTMTGDNLPPMYDNVEDGSSSGNGGMHSSQVEQQSLLHQHIMHVGTLLSPPYLPSRYPY